MDVFDAPCDIGRYLFGSRSWAVEVQELASVGISWLEQVDRTHRQLAGQFVFNLIVLVTIFCGSLPGIHE